MPGSWLQLLRGHPRDASCVEGQKGGRAGRALCKAKAGRLPEHVSASLRLTSSRPRAPTQPSANGETPNSSSLQGNRAQKIKGGVFGEIHEKHSLPTTGESLVSLSVPLQLIHTADTHR